MTTKIVDPAQVPFDPAKDGHIVWMDDEVIGFTCGCGNKEVLLLHFYEEDAVECDCGARLYYEQTTEIKLARG